MVAQRVYERWPEFVSTVRRDYGVTLPTLDLATVMAAMEKVKRYGLPRYGATLRRLFEAQADRIEQEPVLLRVQELDPLTHPDCFGAEPLEPIDCYKLGILLAMLAAAGYLIPAAGALAAMVGIEVAVVCGLPS